MATSRITQNFRVRWSDLGSPTSPGVYELFGLLVRVTQANIDAAKGKADAECDMICGATTERPVKCAIRAIR
jgi:hypothetical protein